MNEKAENKVKMLELNKTYNMDCLKGMREMPDESVDIIFADLPYGVTANPKDIPIDLEQLWKSLLRVGKVNTPFIFTSQQPFTTDLINSRRHLFKYDLVWDKVRASGFLNANKMPLRTHESVLLFYDALPVYNPQFTEGEPLHSRGKNRKAINNNYEKFHPINSRAGCTEKHATSILCFPRPHPAIHPTQKSDELLEWIIKSYSNEGDTLLEVCIGVGPGIVAAKRLNRNFIGFELSKEYCDIAEKRLRRTQPLPPEVLKAKPTKMEAFL